MRRLSTELRTLDVQMRSETPADHGSLYDFREAVDSIRLTAWTRHELLNLERQRRDPAGFLNLLASERLRRCHQLLDAICQDIDHSVLPAAAREVTAFYEELRSLEERFAVLLNHENS